MRTREQLESELREARQHIKRLEAALGVGSSPEGGPRPLPALKTEWERRHHEYLRCLLHTIPDLVWLKDPDGVFLACNRAFENFLGIKESDLLNKTDYDIVDRELADFFRENDRKAMEANQPHVNEEWLNFAGSGYRGIFETIKAPMRDSEGRLIGVLGIARDITARKRAEQALEKRMFALTQPLDDVSGISFEDLFNLQDIQRLQDEFSQALGVASLVTRPDGAPITRPSNFCKLCEIIRASPEGRENCRVSDSVLGALCTQGPTTRICLSGGLWDAGAGISIGGRHVASWLIGQVRDADQPESAIREYARRIGVDEDELAAAYRSVPAMSRERFEQVAQVLFTLANQLSAFAYQNVQQARFIAERRKTEQDLLEMKNRAEAANLAKSEFLANMSHEIRTPLNGVLGMLHLLEESSPTPEQQRLLVAASNSAKRLTRLLSDILDLSRVEAGKLRIVNSRFRLDALRDSILELFAFAAKENQVALGFTLHDGLPEEVTGDETRLRQILFNLVGNAIKFSQEGRVDIEIAPLPGTDPHHLRLLFIVRDTGIGISDAQMTQIFEPFVQADGSYTRRFQGAGLGLPIVRKLVQLMGGELAMESGENGTNAYLSLPFGRLSPREEPREESSPTAPQPGSMRVLLAEDDQVNRLFGKRVLEKLGHDVATAENGRQALELLAKEPFDLIMMDIQMPEMNGLETTAAIRSSKTLGDNAGIPIIAMTAHAMAGDKERFLSAGMNGYVSKPASPGELARALREVAASAGGSVGETGIGN